MTAPFSAALEASLKQATQGGLLRLQKGAVVAPQFHCCISGTTVGVAKHPVALLAGPQVVCMNTAVTVDFSRSWSPSDTLEGQAWTVSWGDGSPDNNGNFLTPRNPALETTTKAAGYAAADIYTIQIEVEDSLGANDFDEFEIAVIDCSGFVYAHPPWVADGIMITSDAELYYTTSLSAAPPTWAAFSGGYPGTEIHDAMAELESDGREYIYAADVNGIYMHEMPPDQGVWTLLQTSESLADAAGLVGADYTCHARRLAISYVQDGWQWCSWQATNPFLGTEDYHVGVAHTRDGWQTIEHSTVVVSITYNAALVQAIEAHGVDVVQQLSGLYVYCAVEWADDIVGGSADSRLYRSADFGRTWSLVHSGTTYGPCDVGVSNEFYGQYVWFVTTDESYRSIDGGATWAQNGVDTFRAGGTVRMSGIDGEKFCVVTADELWRIQWGGVVHYTPDMPAGDPAQGLIVLDRAASTPTEVLWVGGAYLATSRIKQNDWPGLTQTNKEGVYGDPDPSNVILPELREYT